MSLLTSAATSQGGHEDVLDHRALRQEIVGLENETDLPVADFCQLPIVELAEVLASE